MAWNIAVSSHNIHLPVEAKTWEEDNREVGSEWKAVLLIYSSNCQQIASRWLVLGIQQLLSQDPCLCSVSSRHSISLIKKWNWWASEQGLGQKESGAAASDENTARPSFVLSCDPSPWLSSPRRGKNLWSKGQTQCFYSQAGHMLGSRPESGMGVGEKDAPKAPVPRVLGTDTREAMSYIPWQTTDLADHAEPINIISLDFNRSPPILNGSPLKQSLRNLGNGWVWKF